MICFFAHRSLAENDRAKSGEGVARGSRSASGPLSGASAGNRWWRIPAGMLGEAPSAPGRSRTQARCTSGGASQRRADPDRARRRAGSRSIASVCGPAVGVGARGGRLGTRARWRRLRDHRPPKRRNRRNSRASSAWGSRGVADRACGSSWAGTVASAELPRPHGGCGSVCACSS